MTDNETAGQRQGHPDAESTISWHAGQCAAALLADPMPADLPDRILARIRRVDELVDAWSEIQTERLYREIVSRPVPFLRSDRQS